MDKTKISKRQDQSLPKQNLNLRLEDFEDLKKTNPLKELVDTNQTAMAVFECLLNNDPEGVVVVIQAHLSALDKVNLSKDADAPRSTIYGALRGKNPTIITLAKLIH